MSLHAPVDQLSVAAKQGSAPRSQPIYGGYTNSRGMVSLFAENLAFRINLKHRTIQEKPMLNPGAQARYDAAEPGESFEFCGTTFRRLSHAEIAEICGSGSFRMGMRTA